VLSGFFAWVMDRHDRQKDALVSRFVSLDAESTVLDVGCAVGTFLQKMRSRYRVRATGVDFADLSANPSLSGVDFRCGLFVDQDFGEQRFDLITMWHYLEHDYDPLRTLACARDLLSPNGRLVIEVPRLDSTTFRLYKNRWPGLQAPQHTVLFDRARLLDTVKAAGLEVVEYLLRRVPRVLLFLRGRRVQGAPRKRTQSLRARSIRTSSGKSSLANPRVREAAQLRDADRRLSEGEMSRTRTLLRSGAAFVVLTVGSVVMLIVAIPTPGSRGDSTPR
jgi:SAM-dependent methyltransferase